MSRLLLCLALLCPAAHAADSASDELKKKFGDQEQILLAGVLIDPAQAAEFAKDAAGAASPAVMTKWYGRISAFSSDYLSKPHVYNDKAAEVRTMAEPAEWGMLMDTLRKMGKGGIIEQGKMNIFIGMIDDANADLKRGDTEAAHKVVDLGRKNLVDALKEYLSSPNGKAGLAEANRQRQEEARGKPGPGKPPATAPPAVTPPAVTKKPAADKPKTDAPPAEQGRSGDDELARKAREQAEKIRQDLANGGDGAKGFDGDKSKGGQAGAVVGGGDGAGGNTTGLSPAGSRPNLTVKEPPKPGAEGDDMDELHQMKQKVKGHKALFAAIGGGLLGAILGGLIGMLFGPVGLIVGAALGGAGGAFAGRKVGKKLWG